VCFRIRSGGYGLRRPLTSARPSGSEPLAEADSKARRHYLTGSSDRFIFEWARRSEFSALVGTDRDFVRVAERFGPPPKVIRIERCDFPSRTIELFLRREAVRIYAFLESNRAVLLLSL
jgi:predicted nuclease of predicted toxin-antitoxin system